jgi:hypothetical protein
LVPVSRAGERGKIVLFFTGAQRGLEAPQGGPAKTLERGPGAPKEGPKRAHGGIRKVHSGSPNKGRNTKEGKGRIKSGVSKRVEDG